MTEDAAVNRTNRDVVLRLFELINTGDHDRYHEVMHADVMTEYPQSGERVRGLENFTNVMRNYPGGRLGVSRDERLFVGGEEGHYLLTPMFTMVKVEGQGDWVAASVKTRYPDGSDWFTVALLTFRDGKILQQILYFAPVFEPPEWRAQWVESIAAGG